MARTLLFFAVAALFPSSGFAAPGDLDTSFGTGGKVLIDVGGTQNDAPHGIAIDASGNVYVAGEANTATSTDFGAIRLLPSGQLDPSFGNGGKVRVDIGTNTKDCAFAIALDGQANVYLSGVSDLNSHDSFTAVRLGHTGALDTGFGIGGHALVDNPTTGK